jgi:hypothetical protein
MKSISERLNKCLDEGQMTEADLARWLDRGQSTVNHWLRGKHIPWGPGGKDMLKRLGMLEALIASKMSMPIPATLTLSMRKKWVEKLKDDYLNREVPEPDPAN